MDASPLLRSDTERGRTNKMWVSNQFFVTLVLVLNAAGAVGEQAAPKDQKASFAMSLKLNESTATVHSEVRAKVEITNTSAERIWLWQSRSGVSQYLVRAVGRDGKSAQLTAKGKAFQKGEGVLRENGKVVRVFPGSGRQVCLEPGETMKDEVFLDDLIDLSQPGTYTVEVERVDSATKVLVKANAVTLIVTGQ